MRKLALAAIFVGASALAACGGGGDDDTSGDDVGFDPDANPDPVGACNPVMQTGCEAGQRCTWVTYQEEPALGKTECIADGTVDLGAACTAGMPGATTGFDDCKAGGYCVDGLCAAICSQGTEAACDEGFGRVLYSDTFDDLGDDTTVGLCKPTCNPVTQDCDVASQGCFLLISDGVGTCASVGATAMMNTQDEVCFGPAAGSCYLNGCAKGYQAVLLQEAGSDNAVCNAFCTPVDSYTDNPGANDIDGTAPDCSAGTIGAGVPAGAHGCGYIQSVFGASDTFDPAIIPATYGICYNTVTWGSCAAYEPLGMASAYNDEYLDVYASTTGTPAEKATAADEAANAALCVFCGIGTDCMQGDGETLADACGSGVGCISLEKDAEIFAPPMPTSNLRRTVANIREIARKNKPDFVIPGLGSPTAPSID